MQRAIFLVPLAFCGWGLAACSGPIETNSGFAGASGLGIEPAGSIAVVTSLVPGDQASAAVIAALTKRGQPIATDAATRLTLTVAERASDLAVLSDDGVPLSPAKQPRLLQNCPDRTQRLLLVLERKDQPPVRAWAEETHCKGQLAASLPALAERAVNALYSGNGSVRLRRGQD